MIFLPFSAFASIVCADSTAAGQARSAPPGPEIAQRGAGARLRVDDRLGDLLRHPSFAGFAHLILPWDGRPYDETMSLRRIGALLPYHSAVDPEVIVSALNRMIEDIERGLTVFHSFYSEEERRADPSKANTGLFFFRGGEGGAFAVICPGGGFSYVGAVHEGFPYAVEINRGGHPAFVLRYRAGVGAEAATRDLAAALGFIIRNARRFGVAAQGYALWGSSAGARMAAAIGSHGPEAFGGEAVGRPATVVMAYTGHSDIGDREPPTFAVVGAQDAIAPPAAMRKRIEALRAAGVTVAYREFPGLGHGFGTGAGSAAEGWIGEAVRFWSRALESRG